MGDLVFSFLGPFSVRLAGQPLKALGTDKTRALLVYLALEPPQAHARGQLATLLWPDVSDRQARQSLRNALYRLRQSLDQGGSHLELDRPLSHYVLTLTHQTVQLHTTETPLVVSSDVAQFRTALDASKSHFHDALERCASCLERLRHAAELYRGDLLSGLSVGDAIGFEEWMFFQREQLHYQALLTFEQLAEAYATQRDDDAAYRYAVRLRQLDPYRETAQRLVMRLLARRGLPEQALQRPGPHRVPATAA